MSIRMTIEGIQEAQDLNIRAVAEMQPDQLPSRIIRLMTAGLHSQAVISTHVDTGALRASHRMELERYRGIVFISPSSTAPDGAKPVNYGPIEHARGGEHAFYDLALRIAGPSMVELGATMLMAGIW